MAFDIEGARAAGYSDGEIADFMGKDSGFDVAAAQKAGYEPGEIVAHLSSLKKPAALAETPAASVPAKPRQEIDYGNPQGFGANEIMDMPVKAGGMGSVLESRAADRPEEPMTLEQLRASEKRPVPRAGAQTAEPIKGKTIPINEQGTFGRAGKLVGAQMDEYAAGLGYKLGDAASAVGADSVAKELRGRASNLQDRADVDTKSISLSADGAFEKYAPQILAVFPTMAVAAATGGLPVMFGIAEVQSYAEGRKAGLSPAAALGRAVPMGAAEVIGERLGGTGKLLEALEKAAVKGGSLESLKELSGRMAASGMREVPSEEATFGMQFGIDKAPGVGLRPDAGVEDFIEGAKDTAIVAAGAGGVMGGGSMALNRLSAREKAFAEKYPADHGTLPGVPPAPVDPIAAISKAQNVDEAIAAAQNAVRSSTAVDNIAAILEKNQPSAISPSANTAIQTIAPEIAQTTQAITELEAQNVSPPAAIPSVPAGTTGSGLPEPAPGMEAPLGAVRTDPGAVDPGSIRDQAGGGDVSLGAGTALDAVGPNVQNQPAPGPAAQGQAAPAETPKAGEVAGVQPAAAGATAGDAAVQAAGVEQLRKQLDAVEFGTKQHLDLLTEIRQAVESDATQAINSGAMPVYAVGNGMHVALSPSAQNPGQFQVTRYSPKGIISDSQYSSIDQAVSQEGLSHKPRLSDDAAGEVLALSAEAEDKFQTSRQPPAPTARQVAIQAEKAKIEAMRKPRAGASASPAPAQSTEAAPRVNPLAAAKQELASAKQRTGAEATPDFTKDLSDARAGLAELEKQRKLTRSSKRADIDGQIERVKDAIYEMETAMDKTPAADIRLGRNNEPIHRGGKPYTTNKDAKKAKALQPMMRVVRVEGGFALAEKTPAQLAAEKAGARRLRNPNTGPAGEPISAHAFIAAEGQLSADTRTDMNLGDNPRIGNRTLFAGAGQGGLTMEQATERLIEEGYLPEDASLNQAMALIKRSLNEPQYTPEGTERMAEKEAAQREAAYNAEQEAIAVQQELEDNELDAAVAAFEAAMLEIPQTGQLDGMSLDEALAAVGYTEEEISDDRNSTAEIQTPSGSTDTGAAGERAQGNQSPAEAEAGAGAQGDSGRDGQAGQDSASGSSEGLKSKAEAATSRTRPRETISFPNPIVGPNGARLVSYTWQWKPTEFVDKRGEDRVARISDWNNSQTNAETGREVVHQFNVEQGGETRTVSAETALQLLGYTGSDGGVAKPSISAAKTLARLRMQQAEVQSALDAFLADEKAVANMALPPVTGPDEKGWYEQGDSQARQLEPGVLREERKRVLAEGWRSNRLSERGWRGGSIQGESLKREAGDLSDRIKRAEKKLASLPTSEGLTAPTQQEVLDQQDRKDNADILDQRQQIDREASGQTLTSQTAPEQRKDTTGDLLGGLSADDIRRGQDELAEVRRQLTDLENQMVGQAGLAPGFIEDAVRSRRVPQDMKAKRETLKSRIAELRAQVGEKTKPTSNDDPNQSPMFSRAAKATDILDAADIKGKDRLEALRDVRAGLITPDELEAAYPAKGDQTETEAFKKWFGDSKVVDADGKPLVVYHGTGADFESFEVANELGNHFGTKAQANTVAEGAGSLVPGAKILPVYLSIKNPLRLRDSGNFMPEALIEQLAPLGITPKDGSGFKSPYRYDMLGKDGQLELQNIIESHGYDGVVYLNRREGIDDGEGSDPADQDFAPEVYSDEQFLQRFPDAQDSYIAFRPEQIKSAIGNNGDFDPADARIQFSRAAKPVGDQTQTPEFNRWFGDSQIVDGKGKPLQVFHGTTADFSEFKRERANPESDMGAGFYFSNTPADVANNYAGEGPDLSQKIELRAERIEQELGDTDQPVSMEEAREMARKEFSENAGATVPVYLSIKNPVVIGGKKETFFGFEQEYNEELDEYGEETGSLVDVLMALQRMSYDDMDYGKITEDLSDAMADGGLKASDLIEKLKTSEGLAYATDDNGTLYSTEIIRQAFAEAGFDGIVDNTVNSKFGSEKRIGKKMVGMKKGTVHYIAFEPEQIKSSIGNSGAFDPNSADIRFSRAPLEPVQTKSGATAFKTPEIALANPKLNVRQPGGDVKRIDYEIRDRAVYARAIKAGDTPEQAKEEATVGTITLDVDAAGVFKSLRNIEVFQSKRGNAIAEKVVGGIVESLPAGAKLHIHDILPTATGFWDKMGAKFPRSEDFMEANLSPEQFRSAYDTRNRTAGTQGQRQESRTAEYAGAGSGRPGADGTPAPRAAVRNPSTVERVQAAVAELIGGKQLPNKLGRVVATTASEIKSYWEPQLGQNVQLGSEGEAGQAQAFFDPRTKTVFLIADNIPAGDETAVAAHELMHKHGQAVLGADGWTKLHDVINTWSNSPEDSDERAVYNYARSRVEAVGMELSSQEMFPYAVEAAIKMGVKPSLIAKKGTVARWLGSVKFAMQQAWGKVTGKPETFKTQDLVDLAFGIAQMENPESATAMGDALQPQAPRLWRSALQDGVEGINAKAQGQEGWRAQITGLVNKGAVKADEVEWSGITDWLKLQTGKVTKDQVLEYLDGNGVKVEETMLGGGTPDGQAERRAELQAMSLEDLHEEAEAFDVDPESGNRADLIDAIMAEQADGQEDESANLTKYQNYQLPGGQNYRELLLTLPEQKADPLLTLPDGFDVSMDRQSDRERPYTIIPPGQRHGQPYAGRHATEAEAKQAALERLNQNRQQENVGYKSGHWDQRNILAHIRFNERTDADGKKVLFIEEIQSDWAQQGKKEGFTNAPKLQRAIAAEGGVDAINKKMGELENQFTTRTGKPAFVNGRGDDFTGPEADEWNRLVGLLEEMNGTKAGRAIPDAPFIGKTDAWVSLAIKRMVSYAAENGFDRVAFVNGQQSADRYDLSKSIDTLIAGKEKDGSWSIVANKDGREVVKRDNLPAAELEATVGKELASKIINEEGKDLGHDEREYSGVDLKVGGEGMKAFYDKIVPTVAKDVLRKLGGGQMRDIVFGGEKQEGRYGVVDRMTGAVVFRSDRQGDAREYANVYDGQATVTDLGGYDAEPEGAPLVQPGFSITPAMREKASAGLPMFSRAPAQPGNTSPWRDETGRMQFAPGAWLFDKFGKAAGPVLVRLGLKAASPELRRQLRQMKIDVEKAQDVAVAIAKETTKLSEEERAMVSDLVEQELKVGVIPPAHAVKLAAMINDAMGRQTDELVELGMLTKDSADLWRGKYLPRYYESKLRDKLAKTGSTWASALMGLTGRQSVMKGIKGKNLKGRGLYETIPEAELPNYEALGWEVRDPDYTPSLPTVDGTVQVWRDFSPAEREKMGEIRDAGFRFVMGYMQTQRDIALGRMFERMAQDPESSSRLEKQGYVQVPTTTVSGTGAKVYGKLAGRWVPAETMSQLSNIEESTSAAWQMYRKAMGIWKQGKTAMNPVSHVNNIVSNLTMAHLAGVSYLRGDKYIAAARDFVKKTPMVQEAKENGLFLGTISDTELMNSMPEELRILAQKQESTTLKVARTGFDIMTMFLRKPMGAAYQAEDTFFRYLIYKDARERGTEPQDAVDYAQRYIFTYDDLPKGARRIRDFGIPFFSYTYKAVPALLHTALTHPLRMAAPAAVLWGINAAAYAIATGDDDDEWQESLKKYLTDPEFRARAREKEKLDREHLPPWNKGTTALMTPKMIRLGMDEVTKLPLFIDVSRIIPGGDMFDVSPNAGGIPLPQPITPSHPLFTTTVAMLGNKDLFRGKELVDKNDTRGEATEKRLDWLWTQLSPAVAAGNYHWERGMNALAQANGGEVKWMPDVLGGDATGVGRDGLPVQPKYAAMQTFGIKVRPIDLATSEAIDKNMQNKMLRDIDTELKALKRLESKGAVSPRAVDKAHELANIKKDRIRQGLTVDGGEKD